MDKNTNNQPFDSDFEDDEIVSKTSVKKALKEIVDFSEKLLALSAKKLATLPISESLMYEIDLARKLKNDNSRRRQLQRIAKLLRKDNHDEIREIYDGFQQQDRQQHQSINPTEAWCQRLVEEDNALAEFIDQHPNQYTQQIAQLIRHTKKELISDKTPKKYQSKLFTLIQKILVSES